MKRSAAVFAVAAMLIMGVGCGGPPPPDPVAEKVVSAALPGIGVTYSVGTSMTVMAGHGSGLTTGEWFDATATLKLTYSGAALMERRPKWGGRLWCDIPLQTKWGYPPSWVPSSFLASSGYQQYMGQNTSTTAAVCQYRHDDGTWSLYSPNTCVVSYWNSSTGSGLEVWDDPNCNGSQYAWWDNTTATLIQ